MTTLIPKEAFVDLGNWMKVPRTELPEHLSGADIDGNGAVTGAAEFGALHDGLSALPPSHAEIGRVLGSIRTAEAQGRVEPNLGARTRLADVPQLRGVASGIGVLAKSSQPTLGTGSVQDALNVIAERLSDHAGCAVDTGGGRFRGFFGAKTETAVKAFQHLHRLPESGAVDQATLTKLDEQLAKARTTQVNRIERTGGGPLKGIFFGDTFGKNVNLTFDDGPHPRITPAVLRVMEEEGVTGATFFVLGKNVDLYPQLAREIVAKGHCLGNHTYDHPNLSQCSAAEIQNQLDRTEAAIKRAVGSDYQVNLVRPPYGAMNDRVKQVFADKGLAAIMWQVDSEDWKNRNTPDRVLTNVFDGRYSVNRGGGALLFHDIQPATESKLREVVRGLKQRNFNITSTQNLLDTKYA